MQGNITAALDVTDPEPLPPDHALWRAPGVLITPHVGGNTGAMAARIDRVILRQDQSISPSRLFATVECTDSVSLG